MAMPRQAISNHLSIEHAEACEQGGRAITFGIMGLASRNTRTQGEDRLGSIQRLDLSLFINTKDQSFVRRREGLPLVSIYNVDAEHA
jgi:hypothetical protein